MAKTTPSEAVELIVGLGNPGADYEDTRHNAGVWFLEALARRCNTHLQPDKKFHGLSVKIRLGGRDIRLLFPTTFMNRSGQSVAAMANFYRISPEAILVAHDELDIPVGTARLKQGGGHGGHNGLRDIIRCLGNSRDFLRLRIGVGHPGDSRQVVGYVLNKPHRQDNDKIRAVIDESVRLMPAVLEGSWAKAVQELHTFVV